MKRTRAGKKAGRPHTFVAKTPSGVKGLDEITLGGLPKGRPTLICGGPGCGKTLFATEFLVRGAIDHGEPGVFVSFEENAREIAENAASLGFDIGALERQKKIAIDYVFVDRNEIEENGEYDLEGLFVRINEMVQRIGARRVVLDTLETLFGGLTNVVVLRSELRRLFRWLKDQGLTVVITAERDGNTLTRQGLEEYVSDCVILLEHKVEPTNTVRTLRVVKYRGSTHGTNEYPFLIDATGISVMPITSLGLDADASTGRISSGISRLDAMLGGKGYFKGSTVLLSGSAGTGKTSIAASLAVATCKAGKRCLYFAYEESVSQLSRNMKSIGLDLLPHLESGLLQVVAARPYLYGLEMHLVAMHTHVIDFKPAVVIVDPITNLSIAGGFAETRSMLTRLIDFLKNRGITTCFTSLTDTSAPVEDSDVGVSSLIDTWIAVRAVETGGERNRVLVIVKSRGMAHSNQTSEFVMSKRGLTLLDTSVGPTGMLTGSARLVDQQRRTQADQQRERALATRRAALERQRRALQREEEDFDLLSREEAHWARRTESDQEALARSRWAFGPLRRGA